MGLLGHRLATARIEVDLVAEDGDVLVACEVKTSRRVGRFRPADRFGPRTARRLWLAAEDLAQRRGKPRFRVDLLEVLLPPFGRARVTWRRGQPRRAGV